MLVLTHKPLTLDEVRIVNGRTFLGPEFETRPSLKECSCGISPYGIRRPLGSLRLPLSTMARFRIFSFKCSQRYAEGIYTKWQYKISMSFCTINKI